MGKTRSQSRIDAIRAVLEKYQFSYEAMSQPRMRLEIARKIENAIQEVERAWDRQPSRKK